MSSEEAKGDDRVIATAQHIVKSLGNSKNMTDDMILILSKFDSRFSTISNLLSSEGGGGGRAGDDVRQVNAQNRLSAAEKIVIRWDTPGAGSLRWDEENEAVEYLAAVDGILDLREEDGGLDAESLDRAETLLQIAMARLEDEFRRILVQNTVPLDADRLHSSIRRLSSLSLATTECVEEFENLVIEHDQEDGSAFSMASPSCGGRLSEDLSLDIVRPESIVDLKAIASRMLRTGYDKECCQVYSSVRRDFLDECLSVLGVERMSIEEVHRVEWNHLDEMMKRWSQSAKVVVRVVLFREKQLCDCVFGDAELIKEVCFVETAKGCVIQLLNFGEAIAIGPRSSEKLFRMLDMYDALADVLPDLHLLFLEGCPDSICGEAESVLKGLGDAAKATFVEFESQVKRASCKPMPLGEIHPLTRYVMNYLSLAVEYSSCLNLLLDENRVAGVEKHGEVESDGSSGSTTPLGNRLRSLVAYLESNLEEKSKLYEDGALKYIFLMNNILYIVQKVKDSDLRKFLGDQWVRRRRGKIRQYSTGYLRSSWSKVLVCLRDEGIGGSRGSSSVSKVALKERFKNFNLAYEEIFRTQTLWKVQDDQLREELRISISEMVIPAYRSFIGRFASHLEGGRHAAKYVKYTADDLENHLSDLFEGSTGAFNHMRRKLSS